MKKLLGIALLLFPLFFFCGVCVEASDGVEAKDTDKSFVKDGADAYDRLMDKITDSATDAIIGAEDKLIQGINDGSFPDPSYSDMSSEDYLNALLEGDSDYAKKAWVFFLNIANTLNAIYYFILVLSEVVGIMVALLSTRNKKRRKYAIITFCVVIPLIILPLCTKGIFYLYEAFVY